IRLALVRRTGGGRNPDRLYESLPRIDSRCDFTGRSSRMLDRVAAYATIKRPYRPRKTAMPRITGVHHTSFTVADLERSLTFFRDLLGLEVLFVREVRDDYFGRIVGLPGAVVKAALLRLPGASHHVELFQYLNPPGQAHRPRPCDPGSCHLSFL